MCVYICSLKIRYKTDIYYINPPSFLIISSLDKEQYKDSVPGVWGYSSVDKNTYSISIST